MHISLFGLESLREGRPGWEYPEHIRMTHVPPNRGDGGSPHGTAAACAHEGRKKRRLQAQGRGGTLGGAPSPAPARSRAARPPPLVRVQLQTRAQG
jgi:hypothetical protein